MTTITTLPTPPTRSDPVNFAERADAFLAALPTFGDQTNAVAGEVNGYSSAANTSKIQAEAAAAAALATANTQLWVSGTTYNSGVVAYSPITFLSYRRKTTGGGTTDPSVDTSNWQLVAGSGDVVIDASQILTNKTISVDNNTVSGIAASSFVLSNSSGNIDGSVAQKVIPTGNVVGTIDQQTLTNKTIRQMTQIISTNTTAAPSTTYIITASLTLTLPASPTSGDWISFSNRSNTLTVVIARNSQNIMGLAEDMTLNDVNARGVLVYTDASRGWVFI